MTESNHVTETAYDGRKIYIVGTAHVSRQSVLEVERVIHEVRPDTVCVELDQARYEALIDRSRWKNLDVFKVIREKRVLLMMASVALAAFQRRMGEKLGVAPGAELLAAVRHAEAVGAKVILADRDVQATLKRTWKNVSALDKVKLVVGMLSLPFSDTGISEAEVEELKDRDTISEMLGELAKMLPGIKEPLIDERDRYLMSMIQEAPGKTIVAVVGAGHVNGMLQHLGQKIDREELSRIPRPSVRLKMLKWIVPLVVVSSLAYVFHGESWLGVERLVWPWVVPNAILAGLFGIVARGHVLTVVATSLLAPLIALHPTLSVGTVAGLIQASVAPPSATDRERIVDDALTTGRVYQNRFARVLLVVAFVTLGSGIGALLGAVLVALLV